MKTNEQNYYKFEENEEGYTISAYQRIGDLSITELEIPAVYSGKPVTEIGDCVFLESHLKSVIIPDSVKDIGFEAFSGSKALESIHLPLRLTAILDECFSGCTSLKSIEIPDTVTQIGEYAFNSCYMLESVKLSKNLKIIGPRVFSCDNGLREIILPDCLEELGNNVFADSDKISVTYKEKTYTQENMEELYKLFQN